MNVPLLDLKGQYAAIKTEVDQAVQAVMESQHFILGPKVVECEAAVARYSNCKFGIGMSSGTDALLAALMAEEIGPGDEVITTPFTFFATAGSIARVGARPVFVDIDPVTFNLDVNQIESKITPHTRAIMPVHLYGQMADMDPIMALAEKHRLVVIEDAAQAIGAEYKGRRAGSIGHYGCFSFFPSKNLGGAGDGGMVVTNDAARAEKLVCLRNHGSKEKYYHKWVGGNFRLHALQAAVVTVKLRHLDRWTSARQRNATRYENLFRKAGLEVGLPKVTTDRHIFNQFVIRTPLRDELKAALKRDRIDTEIYYPLPLHLQECFADLGYRKGDFPESEKAAKETLALPIYPELSDAQAEHVADSIARFLSDHPKSPMPDTTWHLQFDNPNFLGWLVVTAYLAAAGSCAWAGFKSKKSVWWLLAGTLLFLGINKQLNLQTLMIVIGRRAALAGGWYENRRMAQTAFSVLFLGAAVICLGIFSGRAKTFLSENHLAFGGIIILLVFVVLRASTINHANEWFRVDLKDEHWAWIMEVFGSSLITVSAIGAGKSADLHPA